MGQISTKPGRSHIIGSGGVWDKLGSVCTMLSGRFFSVLIDSAVASSSNFSKGSMKMYFHMDYLNFKMLRVYSYILKIGKNQTEYFYGLLICNIWGRPLEVIMQMNINEWLESLWNTLKCQDEGNLRIQEGQECDSILRSRNYYWHWDLFWRKSVCPDRGKTRVAEEKQGPKNTNLVVSSNGDIRKVSWHGIRMINQAEKK